MRVDTRMSIRCHGEAHGTQPLSALLLADRAADMTRRSSGGTIWNQTIPGQHGRPPGRHRDAQLLDRRTRAGQVRPGFIADRWTARLSTVSGGVSCGPVGLTAMWLHDFWWYDELTDEVAVAERQAQHLAGERADQAEPNP